MTRSAFEFLQDIDEVMGLAGATKAFQSSHGTKPGKTYGSLRDVNKAHDDLEKAGQHDAAAQEHEGQAVQARGMGNKSVASLHSDASDHHAALSSIHTDLAQKHLQKKPGAAMNLGESGFGQRTVDPDSLYKPFDPREKVNFAPVPIKSQHFTVNDLRRIVETVCQQHHVVLQVLRFDGDEGFMAQVTSVAGMFPGTSPSCTTLQQAFVMAVRAEHPTGVVELLDQTNVPAERGYSRKSVWRFSLRAARTTW